MVVFRTYSFRLEPTPDQHDRLKRLVGCARFVWNRGVKLTHTYRAWGERVPRYNNIEAHLKSWKRAFPFLEKDGEHNSLQQRLMELGRAWSAALDPKKPDAEPPRLKKRGDGDWVRFPKGFALHGNRISLPKLGFVRFRKSRHLPDGAEVRSVVVTRDGGHWFVHLQAALDVPDRESLTEANLLGLDLGVARFLTASDGTVFPALTARYERLQAKLAREQRRLARKERGSNNRARQRERVAAVHRKLRRIRADFCHQVSTALAKNHGWVAVEDVNIGGMTKSARGTVDAPGTNVAAKAGLNRSIMAQGWGIFLAMLEYKLVERGGALIRVDPAHTSQACPACGHTEGPNRPDQATFACRACGFTDHADHVGAINVRQRGIDALATA